MTISATPLWLALSGALVLIVLPLLGVLIWQHRNWRETEDKLSETEDRHSAVAAALDASPDGYFGWFGTADSTDTDGTPANDGRCSRRLAVLLDLYRGLDATFEDVLSGFDTHSGNDLAAALATLRRDGRGFILELSHTATGRRIEARGVRTNSDNDAATVDMVWMSDVTEGLAAVEQLTQENQSLNESTVRLTSALDGLTSPVWLRDDDLSLIYCNAAFVKAVDARSSSDVTSRGREIAPRSSVREVRALAAAARASGITRSAPFHMIIDGSRRLMEVTESPVGLHHRDTDSDVEDESDTEATPSLFGDGSGLMTAGIAYDITRQEELETHLSRETASHAEVLERLGTAIAVFGADQRLSFHNTAFAKLWQLDPFWLRDGPSYGEILESLRDQRRLPEVADFPAFKEKELDRFHSLIDPLEDVLHLPDGGTLRRVIAPHPMGGLLATYEDVTDTLAMERSYNTLIAVQQETIDNLSEAIAVFSADGQLQLANPAFLVLWDLPKTVISEQVSITQTMDMMADLITDQNALAEFRDLTLGALSLEPDRLTRQTRLERRDGVTIEVVAASLPDGGVLFSYDDVSDPARVERALRSRARTLSANEKLRSAFISNAMDELRRTLANLKQDKGPDLMRLVEDISELAALDSEQDTLQLDSFDLPAVVDSVRSVTQESLKANAWALDITIANTVGWVVGDKRRIRQMIYHLITGALAGAPNDSAATLTIRRADEGDQHSDMIIEVVGPPNPDRADDVHFAGLALVRHVAELHGGALNVPSSQDGERRAVCTLPAGS